MKMYISYIENMVIFQQVMLILGGVSAFTQNIWANSPVIPQPELFDARKKTIYSPKWWLV